MLQNSILLRRIGIFLAVLIGISGLLAGCSSNADRQLSVGDSAPDFNALAADGQSISLSDYKDQQPVLLFFHMAVG